MVINVSHIYKIHNLSNYMESEKKERFKRLAVYRTNEVLKRLKVLGNCSNRSTYDYTEDEINRIFSEIEKSVRATKGKFHYPKTKQFKL